MTCIVGLVDGDTVWIGGDSAGVNSNWDLTVRTDEKVFRNGSFLMGFTSSFRMGQLLRFQLKPPEHPARMATMRYMSTIFIDSVRECLKKGGYIHIKDEVEQGGTFLIGYRGELWGVHSDFQISRPWDHFDAVGSGAELARGALFATRHGSLGPKERATVALKAAERMNAAVRGPFKIQSVGKDA